mgnify:CR=1 FL=1
MHLRTRSQAEVLHLAKEIVRLGVPAAEGADGVASVKFGVLFNDDDVGNYFEALNGTLRAAKRLKRELRREKLQGMQREDGREVCSSALPLHPGSPWHRNRCLEYHDMVVGWFLPRVW